MSALVNNMTPSVTKPSANMLLLYRKISDIRRTKTQNLNDSRLVLQLFWPNPMKPGV